MRAVWITRHGGPEVLEVRETPDPTPKAGEVRVRAQACGLNFAELMARQGMYPGAPKPPCVVGYEAAGVVDAVDDGVTGFDTGDRVVLLSNFGGHADTICAPARAVRRLPEGVGFAEAAALPVNYLTAYLMLYRVAPRLPPKSRVLIHMAAGGVGLAALQLARLLELETFGTASASKHPVLRENGLDHPIDYRNQDYAARVRELTGGGGVDLILDPLGGRDWKKGMGLLRACGMLIAFGFANLNKGSSRDLLHVAGQALGIPLVNPLTLMNQNRAVAGFHLGRLWHEPELVGQAFDALLAMLAAGQIRPHVDRSYPFAAAAEAHHRMASRQNVGKVILTPG